jgi:exopolysaccharide biosynthesis polyprenyl glycosylphosphotransferase
MEFRTSRQRADGPDAPRTRGLKVLEGAGDRRRRAVVATTYGHRDFWTRRFLAVADAAGLLFALAISEPFGKETSFDTHLLWGLLAVPVWIVLMKAYGLYERDAKRVSHSTVDDIPWVFHAVLVGVLLLWLYYKLVSAHQLVLSEVVVLSTVLFAGTLLLRFGARALAIRVLTGERVLLVGEDPMANVLVRKMRAHPEYGLDPIGAVTVSGTATESTVPVVGSLDDLSSVVVANDVERIVVSPSGLGDHDQLELLRRCRELSLKVSFLPHVFDVMGPAVAIDDVEGITLVGINPPLLSPSSRFMKRALDVVTSAVLLLLTLPLLVLIAIAIKLDSRGPVFFRQQRVGKDGRPFMLLKFRTMCEDAEERVEELRKFSKDPHWLHLEHDPRLTRVGRFLRLASLDELPQLLNVLHGEMSLVGPRPLVESEDRRVGGWGRSRLELTPGITGSWQVLGRTTIPFDEMVKLDYLYVVNWSLWNDVRLMLRTLPVVLKRSGAN